MLFLNLNNTHLKLLILFPQIRILLLLFLLSFLLSFLFFLKQVKIFANKNVKHLPLTFWLVFYLKLALFQTKM